MTPPRVFKGSLEKGQVTRLTGCEICILSGSRGKRASEGSDTSSDFKSHDFLPLALFTRTFQKKSSIKALAERESLHSQLEEVFYNAQFWYFLMLVKCTPSSSIGEQ